jgi:Predicted AAA-ATPase/PD-(D/E)XK nuclease superfamily
MLQQLTLSYADFRIIRENNYKYIDKTEYIYKLASKGQMYFLSRPRRFGKSMTISALSELYKGSKELFEGLWIESRWDWAKRNPVIHISFKDLDFVTDGLTAVLAKRLLAIGAEYGITLHEKSPRERFRELLHELAKTAHVVVLIDEYDAPMMHYLGVNTPLAIENREILKEFYTVLKENDRFVEMVFITGVSKFAKVGIFSGLNNFTDISMHREYATMLGYTQAELELNFDDYLIEIATEMEITKAELLDKMRFWYNGYKFEENAKTVYNPISTNSFIDARKFKNFWFETGTPTYLLNYLRENPMYRFSAEATPETAFNSFEIEYINTHGLLYQTGYLTIKGLDELGFYILDYPNYEVEKSMTGYLLDIFSGLKRTEGIVFAGNMERSFAKNDIPKVISILQTLFKSLPYQLYINQNEAFYHAIVYLFFSYIGIIVQSEVCTSDGRCDAIVQTKTHIYILEFKLDQSPEAAFAQIIDKDYAQAQLNRGKPVIGIGINFSSETKNVTGYFMQEIS